MLSCNCGERFHVAHWIWQLVLYVQHWTIPVLRLDLTSEYEQVSQSLEGKHERTTSCRHVAVIQRYEL